jgi:hypothetical protein
MEAALLGLRKSYRDACQAKKAAGLLLASLLLLIYVDTTPVLAASSDDRIEPIHVFECAASEAIEAVLDAPQKANCHYVGSGPGKAACPFSQCDKQHLIHAFERQNETLVFFHRASKFATFDLKLRKSRDPPLTTTMIGW